LRESVATSPDAKGESRNRGLIALMRRLHSLVRYLWLGFRVIAAKCGTPGAFRSNRVR
jgi:hypothetical protein